MNRSNNKFKIGDWVLRTNGLYKGRIGKVVEVKWNIYGVEFPPTEEYANSARYYCLPNYLTHDPNYVKKLELL
jgi:hypothetical protein